jgi:hypothetical protein
VEGGCFVLRDFNRLALRDLSLIRVTVLVFEQTKRRIFHHFQKFLLFEKWQSRGYKTLTSRAGFVLGVKQSATKVGLHLGLILQEFTIYDAAYEIKGPLLVLQPWSYEGKH